MAKKDEVVSPKRSDKKLVVIIVVVAVAVVLGVPFMLGVFSGISDRMSGMTCTSNPTNEIVVTVQKAMSGLDVSTDSICLSIGTSLTTDSISQKIAQPPAISFSCDSAEPICQQIDLKPFEITARSNLQLKLLISCAREGGPVEYTCDLKVMPVD